MATTPFVEPVELQETGTVEILGLRLPLVEPDGALRRILRRFGESPVVLYFINAHTASLAWRDGRYHEVLRGADVLLNDGVALAVAARLLGCRFPADLPGNVIVPMLLACESMPRPTRVFLLGSGEDVVTRAARRLVDEYPHVRVVGAHHGFFTPHQEGDLVGKIVACQPHLLLVGMGNPRQEQFIHRHRQRFGNCILAGVGGLIDIWGGQLRDYPRWATRLRLHWLCRLLQEPRRLAGRYLVEVPLFWWRVLYGTRRPSRRTPRRFVSHG